METGKERKKVQLIHRTIKGSFKSSETWKTAW